MSKQITGGTISNGVIYSLPRQNLDFTLTRSKVTKEKLQEAFDKAKKAEGEAQALVTTQEKTTIRDLETKLASASETAKGKLALDLELAKLELLVLKKKLLAKSEETSKAKDALDNFPGDHFKDTIELKPSDPVPSDQKYVAELNPGYFNSETVEIKTTKEGLLSGGSARSEGQLDEIFVGVVSAFAALKTPSFTVESHSEHLPPVTQPQNCDAEETSFKATIDPTDNRTLQNLQIALGREKLCYRLCQKSSLREAASLQGEAVAPGLLYPRSTALQFDLYKTDGLQPVYLKSFYPTVIDLGTLGVISLDKAWFATNDYEYEFSNGLLTRYKAVTPNEFVSFLAMFPTAAKALVSIPAEIISLKVDYSSKEKAYYEAQQAVLAARLAYEAAVEAAPDQ